MYKSIFDDSLKNDSQFNSEIIERAANLTPSLDAYAKVLEFTEKVKAALQKEMEKNTVPDVKIESISLVGSYSTDTVLCGNLKSDIVVQLSTLPSFETVNALGNKVVENVRKANPKDVSTSVAQEYGCCIMTPNAQVKILITILPENSTKLEPQLHLSEQIMMKNFFAIRHVTWFKTIEQGITPEFLLELKALIRVIKDVRNRYEEFRSLSIWALQYLAYYAISNGPNRERISLGAAFRRFFEILASGILLPKAMVLNDPASSTYRIGWDMSYNDMDLVCMTAQVFTQIFATGDNGYRAILGTNPDTTNLDLAKTTSTWGDIEITPLQAAFEENCMEPCYNDDVIAPQ
ncbi:unnamed protein product [Caenorhabditis bovis]|uniref:DZF domain-containing protein n=1 Tax=Caenorhabditis bovis TaxID=2654633 RepID=A0A8S1E403_9PELO|nr:unnamed protein product [Caenorhabditis bovis]